MSDSHFVTTPIGFCVKEDTLYIITGKKEHDLDNAKMIAASAIGATPDTVVATPPEHMPAMVRVLVIKSVDKPMSAADAESAQMKSVVSARENARKAFQDQGFRAAFKPRTNDTRLPATKPASDAPVGGDAPRDPFKQ